MAHARKTNTFEDMGDLADRMSDEMKMAFGWSRAGCRHINPFCICQSLILDFSQCQTSYFNKLFEFCFCSIKRRAKNLAIFGGHTSNFFKQSREHSFAAQKTHCKLLKLATRLCRRNRSLGFPFYFVYIFNHMTGVLYQK